MLFNIGDEVRIVAHSCGSTQIGGHHPNMATHVGEVLKISWIDRRGDRVGYRLEGNEWLWDERLLEPAVEGSSKNKHQRVINKIKQMETRRKQLGYKTYQFVTVQDEEPVVYSKYSQLIRFDALTF